MIDAKSVMTILLAEIRAPANCSLISRFIFGAVRVSRKVLIRQIESGESHHDSVIKSVSQLKSETEYRPEHISNTRSNIPFFIIVAVTVSCPS